ncbi:hypothetical protein ACROYT_G027588 [Oculina patagonica]
MATRRIRRRRRYYRHYGGIAPSAIRTIGSALVSAGKAAAKAAGVGALSGLAGYGAKRGSELLDQKLQSARETPTPRTTVIKKKKGSWGTCGDNDDNDVVVVVVDDDDDDDDDDGGGGGGGGGDDDDDDDCILTAMTVIRTSFFR